MDLKGSETLKNLARAFAGESQARGRYHFYAGKLRKEGHEALYRTITEIENNELAHSKVFMNYLTDNPEMGYPNIDFDAGYPYVLGDVITNLKAAQHGEEEEATVIYPKFAEIAKQEGFPEIAATFEMVVKVEEEHAKMFEKMIKHLSNSTLYSRDTEVKWKCENCGFEYTGKKAPEPCPLCKHPVGYMKTSL
ncbi:MAG: rubrerythrin family protein [Oscillospiraceae bacterium]|nr:rubrerythrin family protein [Oscillospiraceae bacterium]